MGWLNKQILDEYQCLTWRLDGKKRTADLVITYEDIDLQIVKKYPKILLELKEPDRKFIFSNKNYFEGVDQFKEYMNSKSCQTIGHGIIFNIRQLQVFRKHGNVIFFITKVIDFLLDFNDQSQ